MSTQKPAPEKSAQPADLENKSLQPATEDKAAEPAAAGGVDFVLSGHYLDHLPGDTITISEDLARDLAAEGYGKRA